MRALFVCPSALSCVAIDEQPLDSQPLAPPCQPEDDVDDDDDAASAQPVDDDNEP